jgi:hypothetical protein
MTRTERLSFAALCALASAGIALKLARIADMAEGAGDPSLLALVPLSVGRDLLVACVLAAVAWACAVRARALTSLRWARASGFVSGGACVFGLFFCFANAVSYSTTQAPLTFQRLRGDEGAGLGQLGLLAFADVVPGIEVALAGIVALGAAYAVGGRVRRGVALAAFACVLVAGAASESARAMHGGTLVARLAEQPLLVLGKSVLDELAPARPKPSHKSRYPKSATPELWAEIERASTTPSAPEVRPRIIGPKPGGHRPYAKNAIVFLAETLSFKHSSFGGLHDSTPNMKRRAAEGLTMTRAYSPYCLSIQAIYGTVCSDWPVPTGVNIAGINPRIDCGEMSQVTRAAGFKNGLFHAGNFGFYDKLALLGRRGWDVEVDAQVLAARGPSWETNKWGIDDAAMVDALLAWIDSLPKEQRFTALMIPISGHYPYYLWKGHEPKFPGRSQTQRYLSSVAYLDDSFERMMRGLEAHGLLQETAVIVVGDHGESHSEQVHESAGNRFSYETHAHVPMFVLAPGVVEAGATSNEVVSLRDIAPTMIDLLGVAPDERQRGTSIFDVNAQNRRVFLGAKGDGARVVGFVDHETKFLVDTETFAPQLYDLVKDPHELENIAAQRPEEVRAFTDAALAWRDWQLAYLKKAPTLGDEIDIHAGAASSARASVTDPDGTRDVALVREKRKVDKKLRDCFLVELPRGGTFTLTATDGDWVREVSQIRVGAVDEDKRKASVKVTVTSDDRARDAKLGGRARMKRVEIARPQRELRVTLEAAPDTPPLCLTLGEVAWRNKKIADAPDDDEDDDHEKAVRE